MTEALRIVAIRSAKQGRKPTVRPPPQEEEDGWSVLNTHTHSAPWRRTPMKCVSGSHIRGPPHKMVEQAEMAVWMYEGLLPLAKCLCL